MKYDMGVCSGKQRDWNEREVLANVNELRRFAIFALTPGIPHEYVNNVLNIKKRWDRIRLRRLVWRERARLEHLAVENAATITIEDGCALLRAIRRPYVGPLPHWSTIAIQHRRQTESSEALAKEFGVNRVTVDKWRKQNNFHPLTLQRLACSTAQRQYRAEDFVGMRGRPDLGWEECKRMNREAGLI